MLHKLRIKRILMITSVLLLCLSGVVIAYYVGMVKGAAIQKTQFEQSLKSKKKNSAQNALMNRLKSLNFSGSAILVRHGQILAQYSHGFSNAKKGTLNNINTMYEIDSMQKSLTAGILMNQVQRKHLSINSSIGNFYHDFKSNTKITVANLLHMNSGLSTKGVVTPKFTDDAQLIKENINKLIIKPQDYGKYRYTPVNYLLLAGIAEKVSHESYETLFKKQYVRQTHLKHTKMAYEIAHKRKVANGYNDENYVQSNGANNNQAHAELGTGQVFMSIKDLYTAEKTLVKNKAFQALYQMGHNYGGGFYLHPDYYQANGTGYGYFGTILLSHDGEDAVVLMSNTQNVKRNEVLQGASVLMRQYCL